MLSLAPPARGEDTEPGEWWDQTIEGSMHGMSMPARTVRVCAPKKDVAQPPGMPGDERCRTYDMRTVGARTTWKYECSEPERMTGEGDVTRGKDSYTGTMALHTAQGDMNMKMKGKRVGGDCDASAARKRAVAVQKEAKEREAQQKQWEQDRKQEQEARCQQAVETVQLAMFSGPSPTCGNPEHARKVCARMATREGYALAFRTADDPEALRLSNDLCHSDPRPELCRKTAAEAQAPGGGAPSRKARRAASACDASRGPTEFLAVFCPGETQALARTLCAGRDFTGMPDCERQICVQYAREDLAAGAAAGEPPTREELKQGAKDQAKEGAKKVLKGLFGK